MNTKKLEIAIEQLEKVHRDMNDCANRFILKDAIDQLHRQVKLFAIPDVVESEAVVCPKCKSEHTQKRGCGFECIECWHKF